MTTEINLCNISPIGNSYTHIRYDFNFKEMVTIVHADPISFARLVKVNIPM